MTSSEAMKGHLTLSFPLPARKVSYATFINVYIASHPHACIFMLVIATHCFKCSSMCRQANMGYLRRYHLTFCILITNNSESLVILTSNPSYVLKVWLLHLEIIYNSYMIDMRHIPSSHSRK